MPSSLYNSVKQSVVEYSQIKKKNQRTEQRLLFRWKLVAIILAILFIVLVGLFSQFLKDINNLPDVQGDKTYIVPLLFQVNKQTVTQIGHASNLLRAITQTSTRNNQHFQWNLAQKIYDAQNKIVFGDLVVKIKDRQRLLFLFSYPYNATYTARFGLYAHRGYSGLQSSQGVTTVKDQGESKWSSIFNLNNEELMLYNNANCFLFQNNGTALTLFQGMTTTTQGQQSGLVFQASKPQCYSQNTQAAAFTQLLKLTGIQSQATSQRVLGLALDVFALGLNEQE